MIVSENLCALYGWTKDQALGKQLHLNTLTYEVIGVTKDLYMGGFFNRLEPLAFVKASPDNNRYLIVKANPNSLKSVHDQLKATWVNLFPLKPFNAFYQDELEVEALRVNESLATIFFGLQLYLFYLRLPVCLL